MKVKNILVLVLTLIMCICFCACGREEIYADTTQSKTESETYYTRLKVTVVDQNGDYVKGVELKLQKEHAITSITKNDGVATFPMILPEGYRLSVTRCPAGYEYIGPPYIHLKKTDSEYLLKITKK